MAKKPSSEDDLMNLEDMPGLRGKRKSDFWWVAAVDRLGIATVVAVVLLYVGTRYLDRDQAQRVIERQEMMALVSKATEVVAANTRATDRLTDALNNQADEVHGLAERVLALERRVPPGMGVKALPAAPR